MVNYIVNEVEVPAFPTVDTSKYPHALVLDVTALKTDDFNYDYTVIFCSTPFVYGVGLLDGEVVQTICHPSSAERIAYACRTDSTSWTKVSITANGDSTTVEYITVPYGSTYIWTSHDIINKDTGDVQYKATEIEQHIFAATPTYSSNYKPENEYEYLQNEYATSFKITASVSDTGILTYQWYLVGDTTDSIISGETSYLFMPKTDKVGVFQYYCIITNTYEGYTSQKITDVATVTVLSLESVIPKQKELNYQSASLGWITGKIIQNIIKMDSAADDAALINGVLHLFNGTGIMTDTKLEVT